MAWYWDILIIWIYWIVECITSILFYAWVDKDFEIACLIGFFWPLGLPFVIIYRLMRKQIKD